MVPVPADLLVQHQKTTIPESLTYGDAMQLWSADRAIIDTQNPYIVLNHIMCASAEIPLTNEDEKYFGKSLKESIRVLEKEKLLSKSQMGWIYSSRVRPVEIVNLNNISDSTVTVICAGKIIETMEVNKAYGEAHEGAVLVHNGETFIVNEFDIHKLKAEVEKKDVGYYTEAKKYTDIKIINTQKTKSNRVKVNLGDVEVTNQYYSYVLKSYDKVLSHHPLNLPPINYTTTGLWFTISKEIQEIILNKKLDLLGGIHALEHAMIAMTPLYAICDRWDVGGVSIDSYPDTGEPTIFLYDAFEGGVGISEKLYDLFKKLSEVTLKLLKDCPCKEGCPSCIYSPKCGNDNQPLDKKAAIIILQNILQK